MLTGFNKYRAKKFHDKNKSAVFWLSMLSFQIIWIILQIQISIYAISTGTPNAHTYSADCLSDIFSDPDFLLLVFLQSSGFL